jgi:phosphoesterase RecJ-like protein
VDASHGLSWLTIPSGALERYNVLAEELDGIAEYARSIAGTRMAIFFRDLGHRQVKVSFRSTGDTDVNRFAHHFGGGGHAKAAGALISGTLEEVSERVLREARKFLANGGNS